MEEKVIVEAVDDIDGSGAAEHVLFALDGVSFEIHLSARNAKHLRRTLSRFTKAARRVGGRRLPRSDSSSVVTKQEREVRERNQQMRTWARQNGWKVADRGPLPVDVVEAYENAGR